MNTRKWLNFLTFYSKLSKIFCKTYKQQCWKIIGRVAKISRTLGWATLVRFLTGTIQHEGILDPPEIVYATAPLSCLCGRHGKFLWNEKSMNVKFAMTSSPHVDHAKSLLARVVLFWYPISCVGFQRTGEVLWWVTLWLSHRLTKTKTTMWNPTKYDWWFVIIHSLLEN